MFNTSRLEVIDVVGTLITGKVKAGEEGNDSFKFSRFFLHQPQHPCISWICLFQGKSVFHHWTSGYLKCRTRFWPATRCSLLIIDEAVRSSDDDEAERRRRKTWTRWGETLRRCWATRRPTTSSPITSSKAPEEKETLQEEHERNQRGGWLVSRTKALIDGKSEVDATEEFTNIDWWI